MDALNLGRLIRRRKDSGSELVELAIVMPILVLLLLGIVDFAFLFQRWQVVTNATREGARLGSLSTEETDSYVAADVTNRVTNYLDNSGLRATPTVETDFDTTEDINGTVVQTVTVSVSYPSDFLFLPGSIMLHSSSEMRSENK